MKINYTLNADNTIKSWQSVPFRKNELSIEVRNVGEIILGVDKVVNGEFVPGNRESHRIRLANAEVAQEAEFKLKSWFTWYDMQVNQAQRATRLRKPFVAKRGDEIYRSLEELDKAAEEKSAEIKALKEPQL